MLLCESSIAALYTDFKHGGDKYLRVRDTLERERREVPPESEYAREIASALKSLDEAFSPDADQDEGLPSLARARRSPT